LYVRRADTAIARMTPTVISINTNYYRYGIISDCRLVENNLKNELGEKQRKQDRVHKDMTQKISASANFYKLLAISFSTDGFNANISQDAFVR